jgi:DNA processing protein
MTPRKRMELASRFGSASAMRDAIVRGAAGTPGDREHLRAADPDAMRERAARFGARVVTLGSPHYPSQLESIADPPLALFVAGDPPPDATRSVAIVGSRGASPSGREIASAIAAGLASAGVTVVSGGARGIDAAAHLGALDGGGRTVVVLGCGVDQPYPSRAFLERVRPSATLVSEFAPGTRPHPRNFPARNRIVAGLARATVVVEGAEGSGSMITAEHAMEFGRDVFAVAGSVTNPLAAVPLRLIRDGAAMIRGADDLLADLGLDAADRAAVVEVSDDERRTLDALVGPTLPERVANALGTSLGEAMSTLMRLELRGLVRSVGGRFERTLRAEGALRR